MRQRLRRGRTWIARCRSATLARAFHGTHRTRCSCRVSPQEPLLAPSTWPRTPAPVPSATTASQALLLSVSQVSQVFMRLFSQSSYLFFQLAVLRSTSRQDAHGIQCVFCVTRVQDIQNKMDANSCFAAGLSAGCTAIFCFLLLSLVCLLLNVVTLLWRRQRLVSAR